MTDEELIAFLRTSTSASFNKIAADRIEALVKERDAAYAERDLHIRAAELMEQEIEKLQARILAALEPVAAPDPVHRPTMTDMMVDPNTLGAFMDKHWGKEND